MNIELSVNIVNYKSEDMLVACLKSLISNINGISCEIFVLDNNDGVNGIGELESAFPSVLFVENRKNLGFAKAINKGYKMNQGKYILVLNPDVIVLPGSVQVLLEHIQSDKKAGIVFPRLINPDGTLQYSCRKFYTLRTVLFRRGFLGKILPNHRIVRDHLMMDWDHNSIREIDWGLGGCMMIRKDAVQGDRIFDDRYFLYFEDVDFCMDMKRRGWKVIYNPEAEMVHHHMRQSASGIINRAKVEHIKSWMKFNLKWNTSILGYSAKDTTTMNNK